MQRKIGNQLPIEAELPAQIGRNPRLERLAVLFDWERLGAVVQDIYAAPTGRPSYPPLMMVKVLLLQQWYAASDPEMAAALGDRLSFRRFVGLGLADESPHYATISRFRQQLTARGLATALFAEVQRQLATHGLSTTESAIFARRAGSGCGLDRPRGQGALWLQGASRRGCRLGPDPGGLPDRGSDRREHGGGDADPGR